MTAIDWVLLAIVAISALLGLMRGFVGVLLSLLSWVFAGAAAYWFGGDAAAMMSDTSTPGTGYLVGGYLLCFGIVMVTVKLLSWFVRRVLDSVGLSGLDRSLGLAIGVVRGGLFACMLVLLMGFTSLPRGPQWQQSLTMPAFEPGARWMRGMLPDAVARQIDFDAGGPLSKDNIQQQKKALQPLIDGSGMPGMPGGQDSQELLRRLGELSGQGAKPGAANGGAPMQTQQLPLPDLGDLGELLQGQNLPLPGTQSQAPTQQSAGRAVDPANVNADRTPDPAAVDGGH